MTCFVSRQSGGGAWFFPAGERNVHRDKDRSTGSVRACCSLIILKSGASRAMGSPAPCGSARRVGDIRLYYARSCCTLGTCLCLIFSPTSSSNECFTRNYEVVWRAEKHPTNQFESWGWGHTSSAFEATLLILRFFPLRS